MATGTGDVKGKSAAAGLYATNHWYKGFVHIIAYVQISSTHNSTGSMTTAGTGDAKLHQQQ